MSDEVIVTVPGVPQPKGRPRFTKTGRAFTDARTVDAERSVLAAWLHATGGTRAPHCGPVIVDATFQFPIPASWSKRRRELVADGRQPHTTRPDLDNLVKVLDGLNGVAWVDDAQVAHLSATKRYAPVASTVLRIRFIDLDTIR